MVLSLNTKRLREALFELIDRNNSKIRQELAEFAQKENIDI
jgi:IS1 family transposase